MLKAISAPWLDRAFPTLFFGAWIVFLAAIIRTKILYRRYYNETRGHSPDRRSKYLDGFLENYSGESYWEWLVRQGHGWLQVLLACIAVITIFIIIWPFLSNDFCKVNKCRGLPAPSAASIPAR